MKIIFPFVTVATLFFSTIGFSEGNATSIIGERIKPCDQWSYNTNVAGFICRNNPWYITVPTVREVQRVIDELTYKIRDLEARLAELEQAKK